ncbi:hypothetical protein HZB60_02705 [candidate division KSB1 bacterium]|nr:hypothetical protein [candidate division KSB1 bacterium]
MRILIAILAVWVAAMIGYLAFEQFWSGGTGSVLVRSDPPGAEILLDLRPTSILTEGLLANLAAGEHSITVKLDQHLSVPFVQVVKVRAGKVDTVAFRLQPLAEGKPVPRSTPPPELSTAPETRPDTLLARLLKERAEEQASLEAPPQIEPPKPPVTESEPPAAAREPLSPPVETQTGTIEISSSVPGARILVNEALTESVTPANLDLPFGMYVISLQLPGHHCDPREHSVRISRSNSRQFVFFTLEPIAQKEISISTEPVAGEIFLDSVSVGTGNAVVTHEFGVYNISFGEVEGYHTPEPVRLSITPSKPRPEVKGVYVREFRVSAAAEAGAPAVSGDAQVSVGVYTEAGGFQPTTAEGPRIRDIPGTTKQGWELAMGDPNRNPPGEDYLEFSFELPADQPLETDLKLRLYLYRSPRRYPLSLGGKSELIVTVNGRSFLPAYAPRLNTDAAAQDRFEEWSLQATLTRGTNRIVIRSAPGNTVYHYLWKIEVL